MTIEQKAKAYDEALKRAIKHHNNDGLTLEQYETIDVIFPELKESEEEKIRNWLIGYFRQYKEDGMEKYANGLKVESIIAWLEKQGEQKPQRMISAEAKEAMYNKPADTVEPKFKIGDSIKTANEEPLTITEITDNGYWSEDLFICNFDDAAKWELVEQKPAWSIKEKLMLNDIIETTERSNIFKENYQRELIDWLKSLKTRYTWKPSEEQIEILDMVLTNESLDDNIARILRELREQLKKLREE